MVEGTVNRKTVVRLGGFLTDMSFLSFVGHLMAGSGLSQILECIYASVEHLMSGKAISRAVRGHLLVDRVLTGLLLEKVLNTPFGITIGDPADNNNNNQELLTGQLPRYQNICEIENIYIKLMQNYISHEDITSSPILQDLSSQLFSLKTSLMSSRTAKLWIEYSDIA